MKFTQVKKLVTGGLAAVILLFGAWTTASAQKIRVVTPPRVIVVQRPFFFPHYYWGPRYHSVVDPIAYQRETGYSDGLSRGKDDAKHGRPYDLNAHKHYRDSDSITYKEAFAQGYADGFRSRMG